MVNSQVQIDVKGQEIKAGDRVKYLGEGSLQNQVFTVEKTERGRSYVRIGSKWYGARCEPDNGWLWNDLLEVV